MQCRVVKRALDAFSATWCCFCVWLWYLNAQDSDFGSKYVQDPNFATIKFTNDWLPIVLGSQWRCVELSPPLAPG